jgi:hypothetical protein
VMERIPTEIIVSMRDEPVDFLIISYPSHYLSKKIHFLLSSRARRNRLK